MHPAAEAKVARGCELYQQEDLQGAVKQWRMAVDQTPLSNTRVRAALMRNIGVAFIQQQRYHVSDHHHKGTLQTTAFHRRLVCNCCHVCTFLQLAKGLDTVVACSSTQIVMVQTPGESKEESSWLRHRSNGFCRLLQDAVTAFEGALDIQPDFQAAHNLAILSYAAGDPEAMKAAFQGLVQVIANPDELIC